MKKIKWFGWLWLSCILLSGCSLALADDTTQFSKDGFSYEITLPESFEAVKDFDERFHQEAAFGAEDTKSYSSMFVRVYPKEAVQFTNFLEKKQEELSKQYGYTNGKKVYATEFDMNDLQAYKFTVFTTFEDKQVWAHLYYVATAHGLAQIVFYSADDNAYEKRAEIIDQSVRTLKETAYTQPTESTTEEDTKKTGMHVQGNELSFDITGCRTLTSGNERFFVIRYQTQNHTANDVTPAIWQEMVTAKQGETTLAVVPLPDSEQATEAWQLFAQQNEVIAPEKTLESVVVYALADQTEIALSFDATQFPNQKTTYLSVTAYE